MGSMDSSPLPRTVDEVTKDWLSHALGHPISEAKLTLATLDATASKLFFKLSYTNEPQNGDTIERAQSICIKGGFNPDLYNSKNYREVYKLLYTGEALFFLRLAPTLSSDLLLPKVWWTGCDMKQGQGIMIMDDLNSSGVTFGDPSENWSVDRVNLGVKQLAILHSSTWGMEATGENDWITPVCDNGVLGMFANWDAVIHGSDRPSHPPFFDNPKEQVRSLFLKYFATRNPRFRCFLHGDPHIGNTYTTRAGDPAFLDWQTVQIGSAFHDVAYFLIGALSIEDRRAHENDILQQYLQTLHHFGGPNLDVNDPEVMVEYRRSCIVGASWSLCPYTMQKKEAVFAMTEKYNAALEDHKTFALIQSQPVV